MAGRGAKELARERELRAWELHKQGWTETAIADDLGVSQQAVSKMLQKTRQAYLEKIEDHIKAELADQVGHHHYLLSEALESWRDSKKPKKAVIKKKTETKPPAPTSLATVVTQTLAGQVIGAKEETTTNVEERLGDPRYMEKAIEAMAEIRKIMNVIKPGAAGPAGSGQGGGLPPVQPGQELTEDQKAERMVLMFNRAKQRRTSYDHNHEHDPGHGDDQGASALANS